jgi:hypothetical protein
MADYTSDRKNRSYWNNLKWGSIFGNSPDNIGGSYWDNHKIDYGMFDRPVGNSEGANSYFTDNYNNVFKNNDGYSIDYGIFGRPTDNSGWANSDWSSNYKNMFMDSLNNGANKWIDPDTGSEFIWNNPGPGDIPKEPSAWDKLFGYQDGKTGNKYGSSLAALAQLGSLGLQGYLGLKQLGIAKDSLDFEKDSFSKQFENQRTLTNSRLRDRQEGRVSANPGGYQSVDDYMKINGI